MTASTYLGHDFDAGAWGESILHGIDFTDDLSTGAVVVSVSNWTARVADDTTDVDVAAASRIDGAAALDGNVSRQRLTFPVAATRVKYILEAEARTNLGSTFRRHTHKWVRPLKLAPDFKTGAPGEDVVHTASFAKLLSGSEQILSSVWSIAVAADSPNADPDAASRLVGVSTHSMTEAFQRVTLAPDMIVPVRYLLTATVTTDQANIITQHAYKRVEAPR